MKVCLVATQVFKGGMFTRCAHVTMPVFSYDAVFYKVSHFKEMVACENP